MLTCDDDGNLFLGSFNVGEQGPALGGDLRRDGEGDRCRWGELGPPLGGDLRREGETWPPPGGDLRRNGEGDRHRGGELGPPLGGDLRQGGDKRPLDGGVDVLRRGMVSNGGGDCILDGGLR